MNKVLLLATVVWLTNVLNVNGQTGQGIEVSGKIIENSSNLPVEYATVMLFDTQDSNLLTGTISDSTGKFSMQTQQSKFYIKVDFIGFQPKIITEFSIQLGKVDIGTVAITQNENQLGEMMVVAEKSQMVFKTDKRVFNVGQDLISAGGSALDVLNNVPSVDVNIEGAVSLRGDQGVLILINGKPSVLTDGNSLGTITADMIEQVEIITNPSAKYDAEGTSGIINIILKKTEKRGTNGAVSLNVGIPHNHSVGFSLNRRTEKLNLFTQVGVGYRRFLSKYTGETMYKDSIPRTLYTQGNGAKNEQFYNFRIGLDYYINPLNVITISGRLGYEIEDENAAIEYRTVQKPELLLSQISRSDLTEAVNPKMEYELTYEKTFESHKKRKFSIDMVSSFFGKDQSSVFTNEIIEGSESNLKQQTTTDFYQMRYTAKADYAHPITDKSMVETGVKYELNQLVNDYAFYSWENEQWLNDINFSNKFDYDQSVYAFYATYDQEINNLGVKLGGRVERTKVNTLLHNTNERNDQDYTDFFPSVHSTYKFSKSFTLQAGYSKRISRPNLWDVNPFFSYRDMYSIRTGNPDLLSEYTHAFELTSSKIWKKTSLNTSVFHRNTSNVVTEVNTVINDLIVTTYENVGSSFTTGVEFNGKVEAVKWVTIMVNAYFSHYQRAGAYEGVDFDFTNFFWSGRWTSKFKLPHQFEGEMRIRYRSDYEDVQSITKSRTIMDLGVKKKIHKGKFVLHLTVNDLFNSNKRIELTKVPDFERYYERQRVGPRVVLGLSYAFGKGEAMEFSGQKMF